MASRGRDWLALMLPALSGCGGTAADPTAPSPAPTPDAAVPEHARERLDMVAEQLVARGITDSRVLKAMSTVPRHEFVPDDVRALAYHDRPLPIGHDVTISQPYIVALMTELAEVQPGQRVLDVGTGSGYQAAVLAELGADVRSIEIIPEHARAAEQRMARLGYDNVHVREGDGWLGWPEYAPYDAIVVAAAPPNVPAALLEQLAVGGRLVIPVGTQWHQELRVITKTRTGTQERKVIPVLFVPLVKDD